jgi:hypothetical protein
MHVFLTDAGGFYKRSPGSSTFTSVTLPTGVAQVSPFIRPSFALYKKRVYICGQFDSNLVWTELGTLRKNGINSISTAPSAVLGTSTGITATSILYKYSVAEISGSTVLHESDLSSASSIIPAASNQSINISGLPTGGADARVTHKRLYRSDNGGDYRFVANIILATSTYTDTTPTLSLGAVAPVNHGVASYAKFVEIYHDRAWYAGITDNPQRIFYSEIGKPEAVGALSYIDTRDGEAVTGLKRVGNQLVVACAQTMYDIQGFTESDFQMSKLSPSVGCISHHSMVNIDEILWFASEIGVYLYDGSFKYMMEDLRDYWRDDYSSNVTTYQDCTAIDDRYYNGYLLLIPKSSAFYYFGYYPPVWRGEQPYWMFDTETREVKSLGVLTPSAGAYRFDQYKGGDDGHLRQINVISNANDDSDAGNKALIIQTGALLFGEPGGGEQEGKSFNKLWTYVESENNAWTLNVLGGDEDVVNAHTPDNSTYFWKDSISASAAASTTAKSVHYHKPERVSGRALCLKITADTPRAMKYRGFGGTFVPGPATRPLT